VVSRERDRSAALTFLEHGLEGGNPVEEQGEGVHVELGGQTLNGSQREVALTSFHGSHEGPMPSDVLAERLLREAHLASQSPQVLADDDLEITFHDAQAPALRR
jgi:hypothetical protein